MELGLGHLGLSPAEFWALTLPEFGAKWRGFSEFHGLRQSSKPMDRDTMEEMMQDFPDGPLPEHIRIKHEAQRLEAA